MSALLFVAVGVGHNLAGHRTTLLVAIELLVGRPKYGGGNDINLLRPGVNQEQGEHEGELNPIAVLRGLVGERFKERLSQRDEKLLGIVTRHIANNDKPGFLGVLGN